MLVHVLQTEPGSLGEGSRAGEDVDGTGVDGDLFSDATLFLPVEEAAPSTRAWKKNKKG